MLSSHARLPLGSAALFRGGEDEPLHRQGTARGEKKARRTRLPQRRPSCHASTCRAPAFWEKQQAPLPPNIRDASRRGRTLSESRIRHTEEKPDEAGPSSQSHRELPLETQRQRSKRPPDLARILDRTSSLLGFRPLSIWPSLPRQEPGRSSLLSAPPNPPTAPRDPNAESPTRSELSPQRKW